MTKNSKPPFDDEMDQELTEIDESFYKSFKAIDLDPEKKEGRNVGSVTTNLPPDQGTKRKNTNSERPVDDDDLDPLNTSSTRTILQVKRRKVAAETVGKAPTKTEGCQPLFSENPPEIDR